MNKNKLNILTGISGYIVFLIAVYCMSIALLSHFNPKNNLLIDASFCIAALFIQYLFRVIKSGVLFVFSHAALILAWAAFMATGIFEGMEIVIYSMFIAAMFFVYLHSKSNETSSKPQAASVADIVTIIIAYVICDNDFPSYYFKAFTYLLITALIILLINRYMANLYTFYEGNSTAGMLNYSRQIGISKKIVTALITVCTIIMCACVFLPSTGILYLLKRGWFNLFKWIVGHFTVQEIPEVEDREPPPPIAVTPSPTHTAVTNAKEPLIIDFDRYLKYLIIPLIIILIICVIITVIKWIKSLETSDDMEERKFISPFTADKPKKVPKKTGEKNLSDGLLSHVLVRDPAKRIRLAFKKAIATNSDINEKIHPYYTPSQLCDITTIRKSRRKTTWDMVNDDKNKNEELHDDLENLKILYEQARYGNSPCTKEQAKNAESILKKL